MTRKRREGLTSSSRYQLKMYRNTGANTQADQYAQLAMANSANMAQARTLGLGAYFTARGEAREVLNQSNVSSLLWGPYYAFVNEYVHKVQQTHAATRDEVVTKYSNAGLDGGVLANLADTISAQVYVAAQKPAKGK